MKKKLRLALAACGLALASPSFAITGPAQQGSPAEDSLLMLLSERGFCTGVVLAPDVIATAAHCVHKVKGTVAWWTGGNPATMPAARNIAIHPGYRPNAEKTRERSIELALVRLERPLPSRFRPIEIDWNAASEVGAAFTVSGYGLSNEKDGKTGGTLRSATLVLREPTSKLLIWAKDPDARGLGACTGDSGGAFLSADNRLAGITIWSEGAGDKACGTLSQALRLGPVRDFIEKTMKSWSR